MAAIREDCRIRQVRGEGCLTKRKEGGLRICGGANKRLRRWVRKKRLIGEEGGGEDSQREKGEKKEPPVIWTLPTLLSGGGWAKGKKGGGGKKKWVGGRTFIKMLFRINSLPGARRKRVQRGKGTSRTSKKAVCSENNRRPRIQRNGGKGSARAGNILCQHPLAQ